LRTLLIPVLISLLAFGSGGGATVASRPGPVLIPSTTVDLGTLLTADGSFRGSARPASVNFDGWRLASDLMAGQAPRFARTTNASPSALEASAWSALGSYNGNGFVAGSVTAMAVNGSSLYVGGSFLNAGGDPANDYLLRWDGSWHPVGLVGGNAALNNSVWDLAFNQNALVVAGNFTNAGTVATADYLASWTGSEWVGFGNNGAGNGALNDRVRAVSVTGNGIDIGGDFTNASGHGAADYAAHWTGAYWTAIDDGSVSPLPSGGVVQALAVVARQGGFDVYLGGYFANAGGVATADRIALWDGSAWHGLGSNGAGEGAIGSGHVGVLKAYGEVVFVGGSFNNVAGIATADNLALWTGNNWTSLGSNGAGDGAVQGTVYAISVYGPRVFVGGAFINAGGKAKADYLAVWNGSSWAGLGSNGAGNGALNSNVYDTLVTKNTLYAAGGFQNAASIATADSVAAYGPLGTYQPDGRIKKGKAGTLVGDNVYNTTGSNQTRTASRAIGESVSFYISLQNDGNVVDALRVFASGANTAMYSVRYYHGTTEITGAVQAGAFQTPPLAVGATYSIKAVVKVNASATVGSSVSRLVTISSTTDPAGPKDAVKFAVQRS
jgi:hypothetical protein